MDMPDPADENHIDQFLQQTLNFDESQFDGVLVWDVLQYLTPRLLTATIERLHTIVRPGGYVLAYFNSNKGAESVPFYSFRIKDEQHVLLLQRGLRKPFQTFDNAQLERLFHRFESAKFFLTREQPRDIMVRR